MNDCEKCDGPAPSKSVCDAREESRTYGKRNHAKLDNSTIGVMACCGAPMLNPPVHRVTCCNAKPRTTVTLPCRRCGNTERVQGSPGLCVWCKAVVAPDSAREPQIDRRLHDMRRIHEIEMSMTDLQRRELIVHGQYILNRDAKAFNFGMGEK